MAKKVSLDKYVEGTPKRTPEKEQKGTLAKESIVYTVGDYDCPHCKRHYVIKCNGEHDWVE